MCDAHVLQGGIKHNATGGSAFSIQCLLYLVSTLPDRRSRTVTYSFRVRKPYHSRSLASVQFPRTLMENHEQWMELCAPASTEQDPAKLLALTQEIARLLEEKEQRVKGQLRATGESSG